MVDLIPKSLSLPNIIILYVCSFFFALKQRFPGGRYTVFAPFLLMRLTTNTKKNKTEANQK